MPSYTVCVTTDCPLRSTCQRGQPVPDDIGQSYAALEWTQHRGKVSCDYFMPIRKQKKPDQGARA